MARPDPAFDRLVESFVTANSARDTSLWRIRRNRTALYLTRAGSFRGSLVFVLSEHFFAALADLGNEYDQH